jgi:hypothetical protein
MASYIKWQKKVLKQLCVWNKMTSEEKTHFENLSTEFEVDRFKRTMLNMYL